MTSGQVNEAVDTSIKVQLWEATKGVSGAKGGPEEPGAPRRAAHCREREVALSFERRRSLCQKAQPCLSPRGPKPKSQEVLTAGLSLSLFFLEVCETSPKFNFDQVNIL